MKNTISIYSSFIFLYIVFASCNNKDDAPPYSNSDKYVVETLASGFTIPWAIEVISEDQYLVTERLGRLFLYKNGTLHELKNIPQAKTINAKGLTIGGLMDVKLHPMYEMNQLVYIAYVGLDLKMKVARFELGENEITNLEVVFESNAFSIGSRIAWQDEEHFFVTHGVAGDPYPVVGAQDLSIDLGKIHRLMDDGAIPPDNPIFIPSTTPTSIWSYGHRDPQGLYYDSEQNILYSSEHGPLGGDELNIIIKGANYGWPLFSYGLNYDRTPVSNMSEAAAATISNLPIKYWTSNFNIAPSGLIRLAESQFNDFNNFFVMGSLAMRNLVGYNLETDETKIFMENIGRVRDIAQLPSGNLLVVIDKGSPSQSDDGRVIKLSIKKP